MKKTVENALNRQMNEEWSSAYLYLSMVAYSESKSLDGIAHWMREQVKEEMMHAQKFFDFIVDLGGKPKLEAIEAPRATWPGPLALFEATLKHEKYITSLIHKLVDLAMKESDHPSITFLQWFVTEQVEEESTVDAIIEKLKLVGDKGHGIFMIDRELATRPAAGGGEA